LNLRRTTLLPLFFLTGFLVPADAQSADGQSALALHELGRAALAHADYVEAERQFAGALTIWRSLGPQYEAHAASTLLKMGDALSQAGKWDQGITALEEALELNRRSLGPKQIRTVFNLNSLCHAYQLPAELERAEAACSEALLVERELYPDNALVGQTLLGISLLRRRQRRFDEAMEAGEESLRATLQARGEASAEAAAAYENVAALHLSSGRPVRALPLYRKARFIYEKVLGPATPVLGSVISQEGLALLEAGLVAQAEISMSQAIGILAESGPANEYRLAQAETNLGSLRLRQKKLDDAERLLTHALAIQNRMSTPPIYNFAATMLALAKLRRVQHRDGESAELLSRAELISGAAIIHLAQ